MRMYLYTRDGGLVGGGVGQPGTAVSGSTSRTSSISENTYSRRLRGLSSVLVT